MKRLFFALWPDPNSRSACADICRQLSSHGKPIPAANLHITLLFLGNTTPEQQTALILSAANLKNIPTRLILDTLEFWPKPKILSLTPSTTSTELLRLHEALRCIAIQNGIATENRPYRPHVTLIKKARYKPETTVGKVIWKSQGFCLAESVLTQTGVEYRILERWTKTDQPTN